MARKGYGSQPGQFQRGEDSKRKGNGRPKGSTNRFSIADLKRSIEAVEKKKKKSFLEAWIEAAWGDANAMSNVANYMLPKLRAIEGIMGLVESSMDDAMAETIRQKLKERFEDACTAEKS